MSITSELAGSNQGRLAGFHVDSRLLEARGVLPKTSFAVLLTCAAASAGVSIGLTSAEGILNSTIFTQIVNTSVSKMYNLQSKVEEEER